jgi:hypothetical protein
MARVLGAKISKVSFADRRSDTIMVLHYTEPTTEQHLGYQSESVQRVGNAVVANIPATRLKYGKEIFAGFDTGAFARINAKGEAEEISCDPDDQNYFDKWREHVELHASDILQLLASFVFESAVSIGNGRKANAVSEEPDRD